MEQNNGEIFTNPRRPTDPLVKLQAWQNSSAVFFAHAPSDIQNLTFILGNDPIAATYEPGKKCWRIYVQPLYLTNAGSFCYTLSATDDYGNNTIIGKGQIEVKESQVGGGGTGQPILPANAYAYNPLTQKYHKLMAEQDPETGVIVVSVKQTGETL